MLSPTGEAVSGARVLATGMQTGDLTYDEVLSGPQGRFRFEGLPEWPLRIVAHAEGWGPGYADGVRARQVPATAALVRVLLACPAGLLEGRVQAVTGRAIPHAIVACRLRPEDAYNLAPPPSRSLEVWRAVTDGEGRFSAPNPGPEAGSPDRAFLAVRAPGFLPNDVALFFFLQRPERVIVLREYGSTFWGSVKDGNTGGPLEGAVVEVVGESGTRLARGICGADGRYSLENTTLSTGGVIVASAPGYAPVTRQWPRGVLNAGGEWVGDFVLRPAITLRVFVSTARGGGPAGGAQVRLQASQMYTGCAEPIHFPRVAPTDPAGLAVFEGVDPEMATRRPFVTVAWRGTSLGPFPLVLDRGEVHVELPALHATRLTVRDPSGRGAGGARVEIRRRPGPGAANHGGTIVAVLGYTVADGTLDLELDDGAYLATASHRDWSAALAQFDIPGGLAGVDIVLARGIPVTGLVRGAAGEPVAGATVQAYDHRQEVALGYLLPSLNMSTTLTDAAGTFRLPPVPSGTDLTVTADDGRHGWAGLFARFEGAPLEIRLLSGRLLGTLLSLDGLPVSGADVWATVMAAPERGNAHDRRQAGMGEAVLRCARTDSGGRFVLRALPAGLAIVVAGVDGRQLAMQTAPVDPQRDMEIVLQVAVGRRSLRIRTVNIPADCSPMSVTVLSGQGTPVHEVVKVADQREINLVLPPTAEIVEIAAARLIPARTALGRVGEQLDLTLDGSRFGVLTVQVDWGPAGPLEGARLVLSTPAGGGMAIPLGDEGPLHLRSQPAGGRVSLQLVADGHLRAFAEVDLAAMAQQTVRLNVAGAGSSGGR